MQQVVRTMTAAEEGLLTQHRVLICDRDTTWSAPVRARLGEAGLHGCRAPRHRLGASGRVMPSCDPRPLAAS